MKIIGLGHKKQVGKDTTAKIMCEILAKQGKVVYVNSFANRLKYVCRTIYPDFFGDIQFYENHPQHKNNYIPALKKTVRDVWIEVGNKLREFDQDVWIRSLFQSVSVQQPKADFLIIPDVRYPNEVLKIKEMCGMVIKVSNNRVEPTDDVADCALDNYSGWDYIILNNSSKEALNLSCQYIISTAGDFFK